VIAGIEDFGQLMPVWSCDPEISLPVKLSLIKLAQRYKEFAVDATLILQSYFPMALPAETGFIEFNSILHTWIRDTHQTCVGFFYHADYPLIV
jgi:hypothetical protein